MHYAPNANTDLFRYGQRYYYQHDGKWYQGRNMAGPWQRVQDVPRSFRQIEAPYFKQPPGWAKGKKTGWGEASMPPGQMKKQEGGQHMPPGQMKKQEHTNSGDGVSRAPLAVGAQPQPAPMMGQGVMTPPPMMQPQQSQQQIMQQILRSKGDTL